MRGRERERERRREGERERGREGERDGQMERRGLEWWGLPTSIELCLIFEPLIVN